MRTIMSKMNPEAKGILRADLEEVIRIIDEGIARLEALKEQYERKG